jgi:RsiW-degrading membrane proteinase PrsW (M82 family)
MLDLIISAITPPLLIVFFIYRNDLHEKESHKLLLNTFLLGCFLVLPMILLELITENIFKNIFIFSMIGVALVEEGVKYITLLNYNFPKKDFNEPYDGIIYSLVLTMGFAMVENIMYVIGSGSEGASVSILRMLTAIPMHATCGIVMGYFLGLAKMNKKNKSKNFILSIISPVLIHGLYNYFIFIKLFGLSLIIVFLGVRYSLKAIKIHQELSPFKRKNKSLK